MKNIYKIFDYILVLCAVLLLSWGGTNLYYKIDVDNTKSFFTYYSSIQKTFAMFKHGENKNIIRTDREGTIYSESQFDSILPLFYYRQLQLDNKLPKEVDGHPVNVKILNLNSVFFRLNARDINSPKIPLYPLFVTQTGRVGLKTPEDVFRFSDRFEFVDIEPNVVNQEKSDDYYNKLLKKGFKGKIRSIANNPSSRKPYENGSFLIDENYNVFHILDVNHQAFVKKTTIPSSIKTKYIHITEDDLKKYYGYLFSEDGGMYLIKAPTYELIKLDIPNVDIESENIRIYGNLLYWNIYVSGKNKDMIYALRSSDFKQVDKMNNLVEVEGSFHLADWIIPFSISFSDANSSYVIPQFKLGIWKSLVINILILGLFIGLFKKKSNIYDWIIILISGIFGAVALLALRWAKLIK
jgi:hypothetical protein